VFFWSLPGPAQFFINILVGLRRSKRTLFRREAPLRYFLSRYLRARARTLRSLQRGVGPRLEHSPLSQPGRTPRQLRLLVLFRPPLPREDTADRCRTHLFGDYHSPIVPGRSKCPPLILPPSPPYYLVILWADKPSR